MHESVSCVLYVRFFRGRKIIKNLRVTRLKGCYADKEGEGEGERREGGNAIFITIDFLEA